VVEEYCRKYGIDFEWRGDGRLRTRQVRPALSTHPKTGEAIWFNHATFFHVSTLESEIRETLLAEIVEGDLPNNTYYGDGAPLEPTVMEHLRQAYLEEAIPIRWNDSDILLLDNMLTAHGRAPFKGVRRILVAMTEPSGSAA
jgi:alpha-ketoglutarate-dependent taurine dioxygenase